MDTINMNVIVLPPDCDSLTDEDGTDEQIMGTNEVNDVPGELVRKIQLT